MPVRNLKCVLNIEYIEVVTLGNRKKFRISLSSAVNLQLQDQKGCLGKKIAAQQFNFATRLNQFASHVYKFATH